MDRATAESNAGQRREGNDARPVRCAAEYVLPYADRQRMGALLASFEPRLTAVALSYLRDPELARDAVQSAFEKAIRHAPSFQGQARVSTWLHRIVANEALMTLRTQRRRSRVHTESAEADRAAIADASPGPADALERRQRIDRLRDGILQLKGHERDVVLRCAIAGQSYAEYALQSGVHPAAVKSRAHRARLHLRSWLAAGEQPQRGATAFSPRRR